MGAWAIIGIGFDFALFAAIGVLLFATFAQMDKEAMEEEREEEERNANAE